MKSKQKDTSTEQHIKETAKRIFFTEGRYNATTQEIADAAGVNRTLLHYYFRSRDILMQKVLLDGRLEFREKLSEKLDSIAIFKDKISHLIDVWMAHSARYPYLDAYLATHFNTDDFLENIQGQTKEDLKRLELFFTEMEEEMKKGNIPTMEPMQFLLNLISLVSYPLTMRTLLEKSLQLKKKSYQQLMENRKEAILKSLFLK